MRASKVPQGRLESNGATRCKQIGPNVIHSVPRVDGSAKGRRGLDFLRRSREKWACKERQATLAHVPNDRSGCRSRALVEKPKQRYQNCSLAGFMPWRH